MNRIENLLIVAMEESAELSQDISKALRFGMDNYHPADVSKTSNANRIINEYYQLVAVIKQLQKQDILPTFSDEMIEHLCDSKIDDVNKYAKLSKKLGILNDN